MGHFVHLNCQQCNRKLTTSSSERLVRGVEHEGRELLVCSLDCATRSRTDDRWHHAPGSWYWEARYQAVALGATPKQSAGVVLELGLPYHSPQKWDKDAVKRFTARLAIVVANARHQQRKGLTDAEEKQS